MNQYNPYSFTSQQAYGRSIDPDFSVMPEPDTTIDPDFSVMPDSDTTIDPDFSVMPDPDGNIDPDFSVMPDPDITIDPDFSVMPPNYPVIPPFIPPFIPTPGRPCIFCNNNQWIRGGVRILNAATGYNAFSVYMDNRLISSGLNFAEITQYRQVSQGYHTFTVMGPNGYVYIRKSLYIGDGMTTVAIVNASTGLDLTKIADTTCPTTNSSACFRICNLAYYTGPINAVLGNVYFNAVPVRQATSFSPFTAGSYTLNVSRSVRPGTPLVTSLITLNPRRIYTAYVLNWNQSADTVQTLLVEDRRN